MKQLNFKKIKAQNFFCFGDKGIEIDFENYQDIVLIKGINKDVVDQNGKFSSNGSGKSSIPQILTYCFYGKPIKSPKKISHKDIINNKNGKKLIVEVIFDEYRIVRTRKPDSLKIWKSKDGIWDDTTEITLGGMPATQELINNIVGLSYESFLNVCVFTDDNNSSFLELEAADKRKIVENLLNLEKYRHYLETAKELIKETKDLIKSLQLESNYIDNNLKTIESNIAIINKNIESYKANLRNEINLINKKIEDLRNSIVSSSYDEDLKKYEESQEKIVKINSALDSLQTKKDDINSKLEKIYSLLNENISEKQSRDSVTLEIKNNMVFISKNINELDSKIKKFQNLDPNMTCDKCFSPIKPENYQEFLDKAIIDKGVFEQQLADANSKFEEAKKNSLEISNKIDLLNENIQKMKDFIVKISSEETKLKSSKNILVNIKKPEQNNADIIIKNKISGLEEDKKTKEDQLLQENPHQELLDENKNKLDETKKEQESIKLKISELEKTISYYDFWVDAFGDDGIRKFVINEIVPALNSKLDYWLQILIDNKLKIKFDDSLNENITKHPDLDKELIYSVLSNGQKRRINLAVNQAFAHIMMLSHGVSPNIIFLDEVTSNIDPIGVQSIYNMICELSKNKKVFITTHDQDLISLLNGCQEITLELKNGESLLK